MKNFKRLISLFLVFALMLPAVLPAPAAYGKAGPDAPTAAGAVSPALPGSIFDGGKNSLIVFVTGIGQSSTYLFDKKYTEEGAFPTGTLQDYENYAPLVAEGDFVTRWTLFTAYFDEAFKEKSTVNAMLKVVMSLLFSIVTRKNTAKTEDIETLLTNLFGYNILDGSGRCDSRVVTPVYAMPVSEYPVGSSGSSEAKNRFYSAIPCAGLAREKLGENYEDYLYCFNYSSFSYTSRNVEQLHDFIEKIVADNKVGAEDVVLVPMSMGAYVVSSYLAKYPSVGDNHVKRVVSIVGCWDGSDVLYDLLKKSYADDSARNVYHGLLGEMIGAPWGYVVEGLIRLFPKAALRGLIDQTLGVFADKLVLDAPSLVALVPHEHYQEIRPLISSEAVRAEADAYYEAQRTLEQRIAALEAQGVGFSFISGYGLAFGEQTDDYKMFGFMNHAPKTNSDEIINIDSTAPGTSYVKPGTTFENTDGRLLSPDGSLDISTTFRKDSTWFFYRQKHELEHNNTALKLAFDLALGVIKKVSDCDTPEDVRYYPQFNEARNLKKLNRSYIPDLNAYLSETGAQLSAEQQDIYSRVIAMTNSTVNNLEADNAVIDEFYDMLVDLGVYAPKKQQSKFDRLMNSVLKSYSDTLFKVFGAKGYGDLKG